MKLKLHQLYTLKTPKMVMSYKGKKANSVQGKVFLFHFGFFKKIIFFFLKKYIFFKKIYAVGKVETIFGKQKKSEEQV